MYRRSRQDDSPVMDIYRAVTAAIQKGRVLMLPRDEQAIIQGKTLRLGALADKLTVVFTTKERTRYITPHQRLVIQVPKFTPNVIRSTVINRREAILHELTHHLDFLRIKGWDAANNGYEAENEAAYYNHPLEMNAYFQQSMSQLLDSYRAISERIEKDTGPEIDGSTSHQTAVLQLADFAEMGWREFFQRWLRRSGGVWEHLTEKNRKRMQKRVYDAFSRTVLDARKQLKALRARGDLTADLL